MSNTAIDIGINKDARREVADGLNRVLADTYTLYLKTHNFHWNVTGPQFNSLHAMFEEQYTELWTAVDDIAERVRALGFFAPGSYKEFADLTDIKEADGVPDAATMVSQLVDGHETVVRTLRRALTAAQSADDESTAGLLADRLTLHEKTAWMLRSNL